MEDESESNPNRDHILDWLEGSVQFLPSFMELDPSNNMIMSHLDDDPDSSWWLNACQDLDQDLLVNNNIKSSTNNSTTTVTATSASSNTPVTSTSSAADAHVIQLPPTTTTNNNNNNMISSHDLISKKRKSERKKKNDANKASDDQEYLMDKGAPTAKKPGASSYRRRTAKAAAASGADGSCGGREGRWAEQLLNPCASAITSWNPTRVQHLIYVLHELASPTGDANHRLAAHGLRALIQHLSPRSPPPLSMGPLGSSFSSTEPQVFQKSIMRFDEVSPWFGFPNKIANSSILQILSENNNKSRDLHILDIGVSHGVQWPTFLESLTRHPGGPPPLVRLTILIGGGGDHNDNDNIVPFAVAPMGHNYSSRLLGFAKSLKINLQINRIENQALHNLNTQLINLKPEDQETLIVCAQFRLHYLNHANPDARTEFLKLLRNLEPKGLILNENNMDCTCSNCCGGDFAAAFSRKAEYLWSFLDSTSAAFKGRETEERKVMEGEAAKALTGSHQMNQRKDKWCERTRRAGFVGKPFTEDTIDEARALLRKYDSNWEMKLDNDKDGCVGLCWKGHRVSFCSLWTTTSPSPNHQTPL
ncbi:protein NODULATION SIGNALING PATHWAY 1 [Impatiens glandulifera]|uniref:protein NODULATION SIGNALING PATHWAY 1 n=1 Tax=Impatiens glandulifera TaxID=253017 RepID=UPI001FB13E68|nr:protein NODULATION SIGNALING PATHWAY 1 [Impatiens glandulifera]